MNLIVICFVKNTIPIIQFYKSYILTNSKVSAIAAKDSGTSESKLHFLYTIYVCVCVCVLASVVYLLSGRVSWRGALNGFPCSVSGLVDAHVHPRPSHQVPALAARPHDVFRVLLLQASTATPARCRLIVGPLRDSTCCSRPTCSHTKQNITAGFVDKSSGRQKLLIGQTDWFHSETFDW